MHIDFGGRNPAVLKSAPKVKLTAEEKKQNAANAPKPVYTITVSLKQWLANKRLADARAPFMQQ